MKEKEWIINSYDDKKVFNLSKELGISNVLSKLLIKRGYELPDNAKAFLKKDLDTFYSPFLMKDVEIGAKLLLDAIKQKKRILIWGDYDVDGVTSVTVLLKYILSIGGICDYYIPKRQDDGYGLNNRVIAEYIESGIELLVTVDSGITAINEVKFAKDEGLDVIITDHHECREILPDADAVINPKRADCSYPFKELAGVGVVFKLICAVEQLYNNCTNYQAAAKLIKEYSEFIAIGTIADVMPIISENRLIVSRGLSAIESTENMGLKALVEESGITNNLSKHKKVSSATVGFILAPRINAAGRMETSKIAVDLFMTQSHEEAAILASRLSEINKQRQLLETESLNSALNKIHMQCNLKEDKILVLDDDNWHHGIVGIVSSRITEKYNLPSILISFKNEILDSDPEIGKGSARSIKGMNLVKSLSSCSELLQKFGGHELAAGLSISRSNLPEFRKKINEYAKKAFENVSLVKTLDADCEISPEEMNLKLANEINKLEPFGLSNPVPVFVMQNLKISSIIPIGDGKHTKLILEKNGQTNIALLFGTPAYTFNFAEGDFVDAAFNVDVNNFKNQQSVQMILRDIRPAKIDRDILTQHLFMYNNILLNEEYGINQNDIPTRTEFAQVYTTLKELISNARNFTENYELYVPYLAKLAYKKYSNSIPLYKVLIILDVLCETDLITVSESSNTLYKNIECNSVFAQKNKVILENAPTVKKMLSKINQ